MRFSHRIYSFFVSILFLVLSGSPSQASMPETFADLVEKLTPAVVNISSSQAAPEKDPAQDQQIPDGLPNSPFDEFRDFFDKMNPDNQAPDQEQLSLGSGFIIDPSGYIVTNNHVIADAEEITVILSDDSQYTAKIVGKDTKTDLALLKIEADKKLPYVKFGNSNKARVGDWVIAIGNPFGLGGSVSAGIISARARDINAGPFDDFIQTDAAINRGNSGGPMFNINGEVIGINTAIFSPSGGSVGIGFAVPASLAQPIIKQLREKGSVKRGWLGVKIQDVSQDIADSVGMEKITGALVVEVNKGSPAEKAGIIPGDILLAYKDKEIPEMRKLPRFVADTPIGSDVPLTVFRQGKEQILHVTIGELLEPGDKMSFPVPPKEGEQLPSGAKEVLGLTVLALNDDNKKEYGIPDDISGLLIINVSNGSAAAGKGFQSGDVLVSANQEPINDISNLLKALTNTKLAGRPSVLVLVLHEGETRFMALPISNNSK